MLRLQAVHFTSQFKNKNHRRLKPAATGTLTNLILRGSRNIYVASAGCSFHLPIQKQKPSQAEACGYGNIDQFDSTR